MILSTKLSNEIPFTNVVDLFVVKTYFNVFKLLKWSCDTQHYVENYKIYAVLFGV